MFRLLGSCGGSRWWQGTARLVRREGGRERGKEGLCFYAPYLFAFLSLLFALLTLPFLSSLPPFLPPSKQTK